ncbi:MAG: hypothetical protein Rubg2KO_11130 [Rubricoccaceae bacterium]
MPTTHSSRLYALALLVASLLVLPACDTEPIEEENNDEIFFGVNYTRLFAEPTAAEIQAVKNEWDARLTQSTGTPKTAASETYDGAFHGILQHTVTSTGQDNVIHYGVVRIPDGADNFPILVVHHGGDDGIYLNEGAANSASASANKGVAEWVAAFPQLAASTVQIWPVYRSETIRTTGTPVSGGSFTATAGGDPSPWDYDVDDSIAFLDAVIQRWGDFVDEDRVAAMGMSRGANTALLHAIRDSRIDAVTNYYGPTDFYNESAQSLATGVLSGNTRALMLPGAQYLLDNVLKPLSPDGIYNASANYASARREVLRRSASAFRGDLPDTQVHHHLSDPTVPFLFSQALKDKVDSDGTPSVFDFNAYGDPADVNLSDEERAAFHAPELTPAMQPSIARTETFLLNALGVGSATRLALAY